LLTVRVAADSRNFTVNGNELQTFDGTEIVRYFGIGQEVRVAMNVERLGKSCFESCTNLLRVVFENGSRLRRIGPSAFADCEFLVGIEIPDSVEIIDEFAFKGCRGLESCVISEDSHIVRIEKKAFAKCRSLRSFDFPGTVEEIAEKCFSGCYPLHRLRFWSGEVVRKIIGDVTLDEALEKLGFRDMSSIFRIEVDVGGADFAFPGWSSVRDGDSHLTLVRDSL
jgi:hypothetical protein